MTEFDIRVEPDTYTQTMIRENECVNDGEI